MNTSSRRQPGRQHGPVNTAQARSRRSWLSLPIERCWIASANFCGKSSIAVKYHKDRFSQRTRLSHAVVRQAKGGPPEQNLVSVGHGLWSLQISYSSWSPGRGSSPVRKRRVRTPQPALGPERRYLPRASAARRDPSSSWQSGSGAYPASAHARSVYCEGQLASLKTGRS